MQTVGPCSLRVYDNECPHTNHCVCVHVHRHTHVCVLLALFPWRTLPMTTRVLGSISFLSRQSVALTVLVPSAESDCCVLRHPLLLRASSDGEPCLSCSPHFLTFGHSHDSPEPQFPHLQSGAKNAFASSPVTALGRTPVSVRGGSVCL